MKKTRKTKVTIAVTIHELPENWRPHQALEFVREAMLEHATSTETSNRMGKDRVELMVSMRVASTVEETVYDASVGGKRGGPSHEPG